MAHTDTVHEKGIFGEKAVTRLADRIIAPGAIDCKGGIAIALLAMKALKINGYSKHLRLILTSDEEISNILGGQAELDYFAEKCSGFPYAINCETTEKDEVVLVVDKSSGNNLLHRSIMPLQKRPTRFLPLKKAASGAE